VVSERRLLDLADCEIFEGLRALAYDIKVWIPHKCKSALAGGKAVHSCQNVVKNKRRLFSWFASGEGPPTRRRVHCWSNWGAYADVRRVLHRVGSVWRGRLPWGWNDPAGRPRSPPPAIPIAGNGFQLRLLISMGWHASRTSHHKRVTITYAFCMKDLGREAWHSNSQSQRLGVSLCIRLDRARPGSYTGERFTNMVAKSTGTVPPRSLRSSYLTASCALVFFPQSLRAAPKAWSGWFQDNSSEIAAPSALLLWAVVWIRRTLGSLGFPFSSSNAWRRCYWRAERRSSIGMLIVLALDM